MHPCPVCGHEDVIYKNDRKFEVEGRPTALCPHGEAHGRAGMAYTSVRYFADTGDLLGPIAHRPWEIIYAAGVPLGVDEHGRRFGGPFLHEYCGIRGLRKAEVLALSADSQVAPYLPSLKAMDEAEREGWPVLMAPLYDAHGLCGLEIRSFCPPSSPRPGESPSKDPGRLIRTVGSRGVYLPEPTASPRAVVVFEGIWDCVAARCDAFERDSFEFAFAGVTANTSAAIIRATLKTMYPGVPVVVIGDRDRPGIQAMARLRKVFPGAVLQGVGTTKNGCPKDYREADPDTRWNGLLTGVESALDEWERRRLDGDPDGRPTIILRPPEHEVVDQAWKALADQEGVFQRGDRLVHVVHGTDETQGPVRPPSNPMVVEASPPWLRSHLSRVVKFQRLSAEGQTTDAMVPEWLPQVLLASPPHPGLQVMKALVEVPVFLASGAILTDEGLDEDSGLYLVPRGELPEVPEAPDLEEARRAAKRLLEVVVDFPFAAEPHPDVHRAAWLAVVLTGFARYAIPGPVPFVALDASVPGSGKGLLAEVASLIVQGRSVAIASCPKAGEELQKTMLATLRQGHRMFFLDEAPNPFGSREWNGVMTAYPDYFGRLLGQSLMIQVPQLTLWLVAANNITLVPEVSRRCLHIRLEPMVERPETRSGFRHPKLEDYVRCHQTELAAAALTILRAYHLAGRPDVGLTSWGSFEDWSSLVRNAVYWVTGWDCDTRQMLSEQADLTREAWRGAMGILRAAFGTRPFTAEQVLAWAGGEDTSPRELHELLDGLHTNPKGLCSKSLGWIFRRYEKVVVDGYYLARHPGKHKGSTSWVLQSAASKDRFSEAS